MSHIARTLLIMAFLAVLAFPTHAIAQTTPRYAVVDLGTFGGPQAFIGGDAQVLNNRGMAGGWADTTTPDPNYPNFNPFIQAAPDPQVTHAFLWHNGVKTDLGALTAGSSSSIAAINAQGDAIGISGNGTMDSLTGYPAAVATLWTNGKIINLGTLGGNESVGTSVNDRGQVVGFAANAIPDPSSLVGWGTQTRAFLWQGGAIQDLGTLGGPDAMALYVNNHGQVAGWSYTNSTPNAVTQQPTTDPFLWDHGKMQDLGTFGGTSASVNGLNERGEVIGVSNLAGDVISHPFLWNGSRLVDLGTLGGNNGIAYWINDAGQVAGRADLPGSQTHDGFLWQNGTMTDLKPTAGAGCSNAFGINAVGQVVGNSTDCQGHALAAMLWDLGSAYDLNTVIAPSSLHLTEAEFINDRGEIVATGTLPNGNQHVVLLEPTLRSTSADVSETPAVGPATSASFTVNFDSSLPGRGQILFGSGPGCAGLVEVSTQDVGGGTTSHTVQVQGNELPGTVGDNGIVPGATYWYEAVTMTATGKQVDDNGGKCYSITIPGT